MRLTIIGLYNKAVGGTDSIDQKNTYYCNLKRGQEWTACILKHFLQTAMTNAHILFKKNSLLISPEKCTLLDFMVAVIKQLAGKIESTDEDTGMKPDTHTPIGYTKNDRRQCAICGDRKCTFRCKGCNIYACNQPETEDIMENCFSQNILSKCKA